MLRHIARVGSTEKKDFIREIIDRDLASGKHPSIVTRFPPEPNGYLHIGHAKSICLNFGLAEEYEGQCNLRFDDTNPAKEEQEYVDSIIADVRWLGFDFGPRALFASDHFERMYELAEGLIRDGKAYVCSLSDEELRQTRGTLTSPGTLSPFAARSVEENLDLFRRMRAGEFPDGAHVLRARIDMGAANMKMRDPLLYRIRHARHHRTGDKWCIYPMYDFAHPLEDAFEGITHSICTLEFENNRELYDWVIENCDTPSAPIQLEFARLNLDYTVMSKRKLLRLVQEGHVSGWDDPRMPTLSGMRRRGYRPQAIRNFCDLIGLSKHNSTVDIGKLEYAVRDDLNQCAPRVLCVLDPVKVVLTNADTSLCEELEAPYFPADIGVEGSRKVPFSRTLYIERSDFEENPPAGYKRLAPGRWVRLRYAYCIRCDDVVKDAAGRIKEIQCTYDPSTLGGKNPHGEKVWGVVHWVSAEHSLRTTVRLYDRLFRVARPDSGDDFLEHLNPDSLTTFEGARIEPSVLDHDDKRFQFERLGYFFADGTDSRNEALVFNRTIGLRDSWAQSSEISSSRSPSATQKSSRAASRPPKKSRAEIRAAARKADPDLAARYQHYRDRGLNDEDADLLSGSRAWGDRFEELLGGGLSERDASKWLTNEHPRENDEPIPLASAPEEFARVVELVSERKIAATAGRKLWHMLAQDSGSADALVEREGLLQVSDSSKIAPLVEEVLAAHPDKVAAYRQGKTGLMGFFVGQVMKNSKGNADAQQVKELLAEKLA